MEKPSIWQRSPLSPTQWPAEAFSARRCLIFLAGFTGALAVGLVLGLLATFVLGTAATGRANVRIGTVLVETVAIYVAILVEVLLLLPSTAERSIREIGLRRPSARDLRDGAIGAIAMYVVVAVAAVVQRDVFHLEGTQAAVALFGTTHDPVLIGGLTVIAVFVAPLVEELTFRGFVFNAFLRYVPFGYAAAASGLLFALAHWDRTAFVPLALGGVVLAAVYYRTGSLYASMLTHGTFNALNVVLVLVTGGKG